MDDIKVAFETIIVGVLAIPWLAVLFYGVSALFNRFAGSNPLQDLVLQLRGEHTIGEGAGKFAGVFLVAFTYFVGSGISRLSDYTTGLNDRTRVLYPLLKSDGCIRLQSYLDSYRARPLLLDPGHFPPWLSPSVQRLRGALDRKRSCLGDTADTLKKEAVKPIYAYQKYRVYNASENGFATLRHIESEIVVVRGGFLNGVILCLACVPYLLWAAAARLWARMRRRRGAFHRPRGRYTTQFLALFVLGAAIAAMGRAAWQAVEEEYDDRVIALFHTLDHPQPQHQDAN